MIYKTCTLMAKTAPYPPCTVTAFWLKYRDRDRMLRRVTQPPHIAGPLYVRYYCPDSYTHIKEALYITAIIR